MSSSHSEPTGGDQVDLTEILAQQAMMAAVLATAFVIDAPVVAMTAGAASLSATYIRMLDPFSVVYRRVLIRAGLRPRLSFEDLSARRFARRMAAWCAIIGAGLAMAGIATLGWSLVLTVVVLAGVSVRTGWCAGCTIHHAVVRS